MIIAKAPLRMSFIGGGTDLPDFYRKNGGIVISTTLDRYVYTTINKKFDDNIRISYSITENCDSVEKIEHPIVKSVLLENNITGGVEITSIADIPSGGTGLGSSSSFTVSLLCAVAAYQGKFKSKGTLANEACKIEIDLCGAPIGKQDQYAAAYGGFNIYIFNSDDSVVVSPVIKSLQFMRDLKSKIICFYTGKTRSANSILIEQKINSIAKKETVRRLLEMKGLAMDFIDAINCGDITKMGRILDESWLIKRDFASGVSNENIDYYYNLAIKNGAWGGKLLGAGGGGFLMFFAPEERHTEIENALNGLRRTDLPLSSDGVRVIFSEE